MVATSLLTTLLFTSSIVAELVVDRKPGATLSFSKRLNLNPSTSPTHDRSRINSRRSETNQSQGGTGNPQSILVTNKLFSYVAVVGVGSPSKNFSLLIDSASSNTWVGAKIDNPYVETSTSNQTGRFEYVQYLFLEGGFFSGFEFIDQVTLGPDLVIANQSIGVTNSTSLTSFPNNSVDGVLGIGPTALTNGTLFQSITYSNESIIPFNRTLSFNLSQRINTAIPTVTDNLFSRDTIPNNLVAVSFDPPTDSNLQDGRSGELTWGGTDSTKFTGNIIFSPLITNDPYWNINASLSYGSTVLLENTNCVVDTSNPYLGMPTEAFNIYLTKTGAVPSDIEGLYIVTSEQFHHLQSIFISVSGNKFELTPDAQIWPQQFNDVLGQDVTSDEIFLVAIDANAFGVPCTLGQPVLERFYTVFDTANKQVGFANTSFTHTTTNFFGR